MCRLNFLSAGCQRPEKGNNPPEKETEALHGSQPSTLHYLSCFDLTFINGFMGL